MGVGEETGSRRPALEVRSRRIPPSTHVVAVRGRLDVLSLSAVGDELPGSDESCARIVVDLTGAVVSDGAAVAMLGLLHGHPRRPAVTVVCRDPAATSELRSAGVPVAPTLHGALEESGEEEPWHSQRA